MESIRYFWTNARKRGESVVSTVCAFGEQRIIALLPRHSCQVLLAVNTLRAPQFADGFGKVRFSMLSAGGSYFWIFGFVEHWNCGTYARTRFDVPQFTSFCHTSSLRSPGNAGSFAKWKFQNSSNSRRKCTAPKFSPVFHNSATRFKIRDGE
jgi:hypothetical protein